VGQLNILLWKGGYNHRFNLFKTYYKCKWVKTEGYYKLFIDLFCCWCKIAPKNKTSPFWWVQLELWLLSGVLYLNLAFILIFNRFYTCICRYVPILTSHNFGIPHFHYNWWFQNYYIISAALVCHFILYFPQYWPFCPQKEIYRKTKKNICMMNK
jgi:hypothetical protein